MSNPASRKSTAGKITAITKAAMANKIPKATFPFLDEGVVLGSVAMKNARNSAADPAASINGSILPRTVERNN